MTALSVRDVVALYEDLGSQVLAQTGQAGALEAVSHVAARAVPGAEFASITRSFGARFETVGATDERASSADRAQYSLDDGPCLTAIRTEPVVSSGNLALDGRWRGFGPTVAAADGVLSVLSIRLMLDRGSEAASLNLYATETDAFDDTSRAVGELLATHAAVALTAVGARERAQNLAQALDSNREIGMAMGILMAAHKLTREQAFDLLRISSQHSNRKISDLATQVVDTGVLDLPTEQPAEG